MSSADPKENSVRGVLQATPEAHRVQWIMAWLTVAVPNLLTLWALLLVLRGRVGWIEYGLFGLMYLVSIGGATIGMHRLFSHRAFKTGKKMTTLLGISGSMAAQGPLFFWAANHRRHHAYSDRPGDPHSPNLHKRGFWGGVKGLWYAQIGWMFSKEVSSWSVFIRDLLRERQLFDLHRTYVLWVGLGLLIPTAIGGLLHGSWIGAWYGFLFGGMARMAIGNHASWAVGSISHRWGTRPFRTHDSSTNNHLVAVLAFGEGLQNNHHAFPSAARHAMRWWEPDLSGWIILLLAKLGLVWDVKHPSPATVERALAGADRSFVATLEHQ